MAKSKSHLKANVFGRIIVWYQNGERVKTAFVNERVRWVGNV